MWWNEMLKVEEYTTVLKWFFDENDKARYTDKTRKIYARYMKSIFCRCLTKTPDQIILEIKTSKNPTKVIKRNHRKLACYMKNRELLIRTADQRFHASYVFYRRNNINTPSKLAEELKRITAEAFKGVFKISQ